MSLDRIAACLLVATRLAALLLMSPPIGGGAVPVVVRMAIIFALAASLGGLVAAPAGGWDLARLVPAFAVEVAIGATMSLGLNLAFSALAVGARVIDTQIGYGIGQVFNPQTRMQAPVLSGIFTQFALVAFFTLDAQEGMLRGLVMSLQAWPPGAAWPVEAAIWPVIHQVSALFALGFALVAPVVFCLLLLEFALGVVSRSLPQMNMLAMGIPVKVIGGLAALGTWTAVDGGLLARIHAALFRGWDAMFR